MKPSDFVLIAVIGFAVYSALRSWGRWGTPGLIRVQQVAPDFIPGVGAAPPGMEWQVNFAGEWVPVPGAYL
jgi:hypothetical protein